MSHEDSRGEATSTAPASNALRNTLGGFQYLTIAIGCMIGIGWITVLGEWLGRAGPLGAIAGFLLGGLVMAGVAACYAELTALMPLSGGDVVFAARVFGPNVAFFVGWFLILMTTSVASFEALSFVWVAQTLFPRAGATELYRVMGEPVTVQHLVLGIAVLGCMFLLNFRGVGASARAQDAFTVFKILIMAVFISIGLWFGDASRLWQGAPGVHAGSWVSGMLWIAATCAFWLGGFQVISQAAEERSSATSLRLIGLITVGSVGVGVLFYVGVLVAATKSAPLNQLVSAQLPAAFAAAAVFGSKWGAMAVLFAGLCGILATLNAMLISGSRLMLALARMRYLPASVGSINRAGVPATALLVVAALAACGVFLGKGLLIPVVDTASMSLIVSYVLACAGVLRLRRTSPRADRPFTVPGGVAAVWLTASGSASMAVFVIVEPALNWRGIPVEWTLSATWVALGALLWVMRRRSRRHGTAVSSSFLP